MADRQISMEELLDAQKELTEKCMKINEMSDGEEIVKEAKKLQKEAEQLEAMAKTFEQQQEALAAAERERLGITERSRTVKVQLTDEQRKQILEEEGVRVEVVELKEGVDVTESSMPQENPEVILSLARKKAQLKKDNAKSEEEARRRAEEALAELEAQGNPDLQRLLAEKKKDKEFVEGLGLGDE